MTATTQRDFGDGTPMGLLRRASLGDPDAWEDLTGVYYVLVLRWCRRAGMQDADAADLAQEVFGTLLVRLGDFQKTKPNHSFRRWLKTITGNRIVDFRRAQAKHPVSASEIQNFDESALAPPPWDGDADSDQAPEWATIRIRALDLLREEFESASLAAYRAVRIDGMPAAEAAARLGISRNAVYVAVSRVGQRLRTLFAAVESKDLLQ